MDERANRRSSILRTVDENNQGDLTKNARRVSFHTHRIVKTFADESSEVDKTPQKERIHMSSDQSSITAGFVDFNADGENVMEMNDVVMMDEQITMNGNETISIFNRIEKRDISAYQSFVAPADATFALLDGLPSCVMSSEVSKANETVDSVQTMAFVDDLPKALDYSELESIEKAVDKRCQEIHNSIVIDDEHLKLAERRLSDRINQLKEKRRRSAVMNSPADKLDLTLSKYFGGVPSADFTMSNQFVEDRNVDQSPWNELSKQSDQPIVDSATYCVKPVVSKTAESPMIPDKLDNAAQPFQDSPMIRNQHVSLLQDVATPLNMVTMNESQFANNCSNSDRSVLAHPDVVEAMIMDDLFENRLDSSPSRTAPGNLTNTLPFAPVTPVSSRKHRGKTLIDKLLDEVKEEPKVIEKADLFAKYPHLAAAAKLEREWEEDSLSKSANNSVAMKTFEDSVVDEHQVGMFSMSNVTFAKTPREPKTPSKDDLFVEDLASGSFEGEKMVAGDYSCNSVSVLRSNKKKDLEMFSSYGEGCCARHLNSTETTLMNKLKDEVDQFKVFVDHLTTVLPEAAQICRDLKPELLVYENRELVCIVQHLAEIKIVDRFFEARNGIATDKRTNEVLFFTIEKAIQVFKTAENLFKEMQITFPRSKWCDKVADATVRDLNTHPGRMAQYVKDCDERKEHLEKVRACAQRRIKELQQELEKNMEESQARYQEFCKAFDETMAGLVSELKEMAA